MIFVDVVLKSKKWDAEKDVEKFIKKTCAKIISLTELEKIIKKDFRLEISISLVCDREMKKINFEFCGKNKPTNVLSFLSLDENLIRKIGLKKTVGAANYLFLGDIIISFETLKKESLAQKKTFQDHLTHLILHSILHLIGHDHQEAKMAEVMENLEIKILKKLQIKNPYQLN
jgi:probable rRNA maturation factor